MLDFFKSLSGTLGSPPILLDIGYGDPDDTPAVQGVCFLLKFSFNIFFLFFLSTDTYSFLGTNKLIGITLTIIAFMGISTSSQLTSPVWEPPTVQLRRMAVFDFFLSQSSLRRSY